MRLFQHHVTIRTQYASRALYSIFSPSCSPKQGWKYVLNAFCRFKTINLSFIPMVSHPRQKSTFYFQHNFLFSTQLFIFNTTFYFQHNFLFSTQLFIFNTTFYFQHNFFYPTAIHSCHVSRARTFFEKSCKNVVKL